MTQIPGKALVEDSNQPLIAATGITKVFPGVKALDDLDFEVRAGEVHCIVGENGAGKSTLIRCLTGTYRPERGQISILGEDALANSKLFEHVAYVPQEIDLFPEMTLAENLFIPFERSGITQPIFDAALNRKAQPILNRFGIQAQASSRAKALSVADQQLLQIARAVLFSAKVLILDEPTSSLTEDDAERVFEVVRTARESGMGVVYISHKLEELPLIGDRVSVLRNGAKVNEAPIGAADREWLVQEMTGKKVAWALDFVPKNPTGEVILEVSAAGGAGFSDVSFTLRAGEVLGVAGLVGAGRTELMLAIYGYDNLMSGRVRFNDDQWSSTTVKKSLERGMAYLPEDRKRLGILAHLSVAYNISVLALERFTKAGIVIGAVEDHQVRAAVRDYDVRSPGIQTAIRLLSGGNQQKAIIARTMLLGPKVVILDEPTKGIDVGAKYEIYALIKHLAEEEGIGVVLVSSELDEILHCSNRVMVMHNGRVSGIFEQPLDKECLVGAMFSSARVESEMK